MPKRLSCTSPKIVLFALGLFLLPSHAWAGFQWTPPADNTAATTAPALAPAPAPSVQTWPETTSHSVPLLTAPTPPSVSVVTSPPETITPLVIQGATPPAVQSSVAAPTVAPSREDHMVMHSLLPPPGAVVTSPSAPSAPENTQIISKAPAPEMVVRGFAKQVPLAVALRQILPQGYGFSVDPDVDLGVLISFQGGKSWRETLTDALDPAGLLMHERGQMVSIGRTVNTTASVTEPAKPSAPPEVTATLASTAVASRSVEPSVEVMAPEPLVASAPTPIAPLAPVAESWQASRGDSLHKVLEAWAHHANTELNWMAEYDYPIQASFNYAGYFEDAVRDLLTGFEEAHPQPIAELHTNSALGQKVLVVQTRGNSYSD